MVINAMNWGEMASFLTVIVLTSSIVGAVVGGLVVLPMLSKMKNSIVETLKEEYVTKESFKLICDQTEKDHNRFDSEFTKVWSEISKRQRSS